MTPLELTLFACLPFLQFEAGFSLDYFYHYYSSGQKAKLPCMLSTTCSTVDWLYNRDGSSSAGQILNGRIVQRSLRAARLTLDSNCFLGIDNITAEDVGRYTCRRNKADSQDTNVYVNILTVSPTPPDADSKRDGSITLKCSLEKDSGHPARPQDGVRWVDETGSELRGEGVGYKVINQTDCVSFLNVKRQSGHNDRRYTCQFVDEKNNTLTYADYTPVFTSERKDNHPGSSNSETNNLILAGAVVAVMALLVVAAVLIKITFRKRVIEIVQETKGVQTLTDPAAEPEMNLTYAMVYHRNATSNKKVVGEEAVTYSTVKTQAKTEADNAAVYSAVNK